MDVTKETHCKSNLRVETFPRLPITWLHFAYKAIIIIMDSHNAQIDRKESLTSSSLCPNSHSEPNPCFLTGSLLESHHLRSADWQKVWECISRENFHFLGQTLSRLFFLHEHCGTTVVSDRPANQPANQSVESAKQVRVKVEAITKHKRRDCRLLLHLNSKKNCILWENRCGLKLWLH